MKKIFWVISLVALLSSCASNESAKPKKGANVNKKFQKVGSKFLKRTTPSESMQAGLPKNYYSLVNDPKEDVISDDSLKLVIEDTQNTVDRNGDYKGIFKIGNPYQIFGVSYVPQNYENYEEIGTASWYGDDFHGKRTANGEVYNMGSMTAAHPTLPLPSLVRVTNLRNRKSVIVRVNDRGPFAKNRVIDVSERAADILGFKGQGTTEVKVQLLRNDTDDLLEKLRLIKN